MAKTCVECGTTHIVEQKYFHKDKSRKDGLKPYCKVCANKHYSYYASLKTNPIETKFCEHCNKEFKTNIKKKRFCCGSCNSKAYQQRIGIEKARFRQNFLKKLNRKKEPKANTNKIWTFKDIEILMDSRKENIKFKEIGKILGRSSEACVHKHRSVLRKRGFKLSDQV